ncbi:MAG TPA: UDP-glucose/GDP-mannose dehydrogenase family protein [Candidatus Limnocylindrales bacterium]
MNSPRRRLAVIGAGYVGLVTGACLAGLGHTVRFVETNPERLEALRRRHIPIHEDGLQAAFDAGLDNGTIEVVARATTDVDAALVCVGTPIDADGQSDMSQVRSALADLGPLVESGVPLVMRSTMPPGATRALAEWSGARTARLVTNPEFLRQGTALHDFLHPSRIVVGTFPDVDQGVLDLVLGLFDGLPGERMVVSVAAAELIKNGSNAFLALKLSYANEVASLSEEYGADVDEVLAGIAADPRIGSQYMRPGLGFGGSCLPKELKVLEAAGLARGLAMHVTAAASNANQATQARFAARIERALNGLPGRRIALLGLAFKAGTDDVRESPALGTATRLIEGGAEVVGYDPVASMNAQRALPGLEVAASVDAAVRGADAIVIATEWPEFAEIDWPGLRSIVRQPLIIDGRRLLEPEPIRRAGYRYLAIGRLGEDERTGRPREAVPAGARAAGAR